MSTCVTTKKMYPSVEIAEEALIEVNTQYNFGHRKGPIAVYLCQECGTYHLTSKGEMNEKLKRHLTSGKISLQKEANHWENKIKGK